MRRCSNAHSVGRQARESQRECGTPIKGGVRHIPCGNLIKSTIRKQGGLPCREIRSCIPTGYPPFRQPFGRYLQKIPKLGRDCCKGVRGRQVVRKKRPPMHQPMLLAMDSFNKPCRQSAMRACAQLISPCKHLQGHVVVHVVSHSCVTADR
jgi:hypothetical protein